MKMNGKKAPRTSHRQERVADQIKQVVAKNLIHGFHDDRLNLVTVTRVSVTPDFSIARIYYTVYGESSAVRDAQQALQSAAGEIRYSLAREINMRHTPRLEFFYDEELEEASRLEIIFHKLGQAGAV